MCLRARVGLRTAWVLSSPPILFETRFYLAYRCVHQASCYQASEDSLVHLYVGLILSCEQQAPSPMSRLFNPRQMVQSKQKLSLGTVKPQFPF